MLQVVPVAFGDLAVDCPLHPGDRVDEAVAPLFHELDCEGVLGVDGPDDQDPVLLQLGDGDLLNPLIGKGVILDSDSSGWLGGRQLPGRVHHDDVEVALGDIQLLLDELVEVEGGHVGTDRHCVLAHV